MITRCSLVLRIRVKTKLLRKRPIKILDPFFQSCYASKSSIKCFGKTGTNFVALVSYHFYLLRSEDVGLNCLKISLLELDKISALNFSASKCSTPALAVLFPLLFVTLLTTDVSSSPPGITEQRIATFLPFESM